MSHIVGHVGQRRFVHGIDLQHRRGRRDSADRLLGEFPDAIRDGAHQLAVNVDRAAAHAGHDAGVFHLLAMQARQDHVGLRTRHIAQHAQNFHFHRLRRYAFEDGVGYAVHAGFDLVLGHDLDFGLNAEGGKRESGRQE
jgi:hypothetical protein